MIEARERDREAVRHYKLGYNRGLSDGKTARTREIVERLLYECAPEFDNVLGASAASMLANWLEDEYLTEESARND